LSSKFGVPLVVGGTYGAIIQHIEPEHIADLAVPRLGRKLEQKAHELVQRAASLRVDANRLLRGVAERFDSLVDGIELKGRRETPRISVVRSSSIQRRFDAQFHDPLVWAVRERLASKQHTTIGEWCTRIFLPGIFKRIHVEDVAYGAPYYTGATLFWMEPQPKGVLSRKTTLFEQVQMDEGTVLVQAFGQEGGLTGRAVWVGRHLAGSTTTHMLVRLRTEVKEDTAYLFGFLQSDAAYRQIASLTYGGSIPHFDEAGIASVVLPLFPPSERRVIAQQVLTAVASRDDALDAERDARALIEDAIEKGATN
jgi:type I restriction enzyme S subunit